MEKDAELERVFNDALSKAEQDTSQVSCCISIVYLWSSLTWRKTQIYADYMTKLLSLTTSSVSWWFPLTFCLPFAITGWENGHGSGCYCHQTAASLHHGELAWRT